MLGHLKAFSHSNDETSSEICTLVWTACSSNPTSIKNHFQVLQSGLELPACLRLGFELWCFMMVPGLIESTARKRIDLAMQSKMANLMPGKEAFHLVTL